MKMFQNATNKSLEWLDNGVTKGIISVNLNHDFKIPTKRPAERNQGREVVSIGRVNYALLDQYIMNCLNDYYSKINEDKKAEVRNARIQEYNTLYQLWAKVNEAKMRGDININTYYDDIVYRLYLLGYHS